MEKSRLLIEKMVLRDFKSYAGEREIGPFHKNFSAVVGPNGSGKSNVIDALLFVFGKRAKKLRLKKVSELVHQSQEHPNCTSASVAVHFQDIVDTGEGDEDYEVVAGSELVVSRVAFRSGGGGNSSKYYVNNVVSSFAEVTALLQKRGIDLQNNRFLILQGEVEQIAMMKPKVATNSNSEDGLLEYLEDIIGSNKYVEAIDSCLKDVESLNDERSNKLNRLKVAEKERNGLEESRLEAELYQAKEKEMYETKNLLYRQCAMTSAQHEEKCQQEMTSIMSNLERTTEQLAVKEKEGKTIEEQHNQVLHNYNEAEKEFALLKKTFADYERRDIKVREDLKDRKMSLKKNSKLLKQEQQQLLSFQQKIDQIKEEVVPTKEVELSKCVEDIGKAEGEMEKISSRFAGETAEITKRLEATQDSLSPILKEKMTVESQLQTTNCESKLIAEQTLRNQQKLAEMQKKKEEVTAMIATLDTELAEMDNEETASLKINSLTKETEQCSQKIKEIEQQLQQCLIEQSEFESKLEEEKSATQASQTQSRMIRSLLAAKNNQLQNAGLCGRLGDLGTIDEKYDVAISTACGALEHVVVETTEGAQQCVEFLRQNNLGRCAFIILEKLDYLHAGMSRKKKNAIRLFDEVRTIEKYATAFYYGLRDTLVAETLEEASRLAYQQNKKERVVTLDGQLIELSGAMSGGGRRQKKGGMKSCKSGGGMTEEEEKQIRKKLDELIKKEIPAQQEKLRQKKSEMQEKEDQIKTLMQLKRQLLPKKRLQLQNSQKRLDSLQIQIEEISDKCELSEEKKAQLTEKKLLASSLSEKLEKLSSQASQYEVKIGSLKEKILDLGGEELRAQSDLVSTLTKKKLSIEKVLNKSNYEITHSTTKITKMTATIKKYEEEEKKLTEEVATLTTEFQDIEGKAVEVMKLFGEAEKKVDAEKKFFEKELSLFNTIKKDVNSLKQSLLDIKEEQTNCAEKIKTNQEKHQYWQQKIIQLNEDYQKAFLIEDDAEESDIDDEDVGDKDNKEGENNEVGTKEIQKEEVKLPDVREEELLSYDLDDLKYNLSILESKLEELRQSVNMSAIAKYRRKTKEFERKKKKFDIATSARDAKRNEYDSLRTQRLNEFMNGFRIITLKLKEMYQMITLGGDAELELVDSLDPFSEGVVFSVRPSKKSWKNISNLSGGEKTLASLALVFALHHYKPTPLYVMDEIDAALDFKNVSIVGNYIKERTKNAQFIIISLRNNMFELADRLIGIYKTSNATKSVTINPKAYHNALTSNSDSTTTKQPLQDVTNQL